MMYDYAGHTDCDAPLGVVVHQDDGEAVRLPVVDDGLQLYERKVGPTAITRRAEVTIPIEGLGESNWTQYVNSFSTPEQTDPLTEEQRFAARGLTETGTLPTETSSAPSIQTADVIGQPIDDSAEPVGEPTVLFRGYIAAVGSQEGANRARFRMYDPMKFLSQIEAGVRFTEPTIRDILGYVKRRLTENQPIFTDITINTDRERAHPARQMLGARDIFQLYSAPASGFTAPPFDPSGAAIGIGEKVFSTNRDTLADVVTWLQELADVRVWFQPAGERGVALTAVNKDTTEYDLTPEADTTPPFVIQNNALFEMRPFTSLKVKGKPGVQIDLGPKKINTPFGDSYPEATAVYPPLRDRFGGELVKTDTVNVDGTTEAEQAAATRLKQMLDEVSGGSMITTLAPILRPFERVRSTPACAGVTADVDDLRYEVQEAVHSVVPADDNLPRTELSVSMAIDADLIETDSTTKDVLTGEQPSREGTTDEYNWGYGPGSP